VARASKRQQHDGGVPAPKERSFKETELACVVVVVVGVLLNL